MSEHDPIEYEDAPWDVYDPYDDLEEVEEDRKSKKDKGRDNPNLLSKDELSKRQMKTENYYDILENEDNELLFTIKFLDSPLIDQCSPIMYYDGGPHAIFVKNKEITLICDYVHPGVRGSLDRVSKVLFAELKDGEVVEEYFVYMRHVPGIEEIASQYVTPLDEL